MTTTTATTATNAAMAATSTATLGGSVDLTDPDLWARPDTPALVAEMRREAPVHLTDTADDGPVWSVLTYKESADVLRNAAVFSSESGSLLGSGEGNVPVGSGRMMALTDPPRHRDLRAPANPFFSKGGVRGAARSIAERAGELFDQAVEQGEVDLVDVVSALPLAVMCDLLDVPEKDRDMVVRVCDVGVHGRTPEASRARHPPVVPNQLHPVVERRHHPR
ncbi:cytochrome P450, partial [Streptomyces sp. NPDC059193]